MKILGKRKELKVKGTRFSVDLTLPQSEIRKANADGYFAYYRGGRLHTEERRTPVDSSRQHTGSYLQALDSEWKR